MKTAIGIIAFLLIVLGMAGFALGWWGNGGQEDLTQGETVEVVGVVTNINTDQVAYDGPYVIEIETEAGEEHIVNIPSMSLPLCAAQANIASIDSFAIGMEVEVSGTVGEEGVIVPCESQDHYLRAVGSETTFCTLDALMCPDGSGVGRSGPQCTFEACPNQPSWTGVLEQTSDGFFLVLDSEAMTGQAYRIALEVRISNALDDFVGEEVVVYGEFIEGNTLQVETLELAE